MDSLVFDPRWVDGAVFLIASLMWLLAAMTEVSLMGMPAIRLRALPESAQRGLSSWAQTPQQFLLTLFLFRFVAAIGLIWSGILILSGSFASGVWLGASFAVGVLAWGLLLAVLRTLAKNHAARTAAITARLMLPVFVGFYPVVWVLMQTGSLVVRLSGVGSKLNAFWTPDDIDALTAHARADALGESGEDLLHSIIEFSDTVIREIMVPRTEMVAIENKQPAEEIRRIVIDARHSRIPVYDETIDNIQGLLYVKDLIASDVAGAQPGKVEQFSLKPFLRPTFYVPEVMKISELLREFQRRKTHMAIVVDEYGGTAGIVTLEDIIEEIVGEIQDEYDVEEKQFRRIGDRILADGRVSIWDLEEPLGVSFPKDAGYETLAGFLMSRVGFLPQSGRIVRWNDLRFTVKEANAKRIAMVEIEQTPSDLVGAKS